MAIRKNQEVELTIESLTNLGSGVAHLDGMAIFVAGAVPGDRALVHIIKVKKTYAIGKLLQLVQPSADRIETDCPLFPACGGCALRTVSYARELLEKKQQVADAFLHLGGIDIKPEAILSGETLRYRNKAQYPVTMQNGEIQIGFYAPHSHRVLDCEDCRLQPKEFKQIVDLFRLFLKEEHISVYDSTTGKGLVRHLYIRKGFVSKEIMVCIILNGERLPQSEKLVARLCALNLSIRTILLNRNEENTNVILGKETKVLYGEGFIEDVLCGIQVRLSALSFYQVNHDMAEKLYQKAAEFAALTGTETLLDLYCGTGTIGLSMAKQAKRLIGVEVIPEAIADAKINAKSNQIENAEFLCGDAKDALYHLKEKQMQPDVVLLDPPRKGCDTEVLETVSAMEPDKIVYISCDPATQARDAKRLQELGYAVVRLCVVDLFPRTAHVESVALFQRV